MQKPSIGRIVHYVSYGTPGGEYKKECRAAIITAVDSGQTDGLDDVKLVVLNPTGLFFSEVSHDEVCDENGDHYGGTWHWPEIVL